MKARKYFEQHRVSVVVGVVMALVLVVGLAILIPLGLRSGPPAATQTPTPTTGIVSPTATNGGATPTASPATTPTPTATPGENTPTPAPGVVLGPQACPAGIGDPARWDAIIGTDNVESFVESVSCANILGDPSLQAMVLVRHTNGGATLDVYVFNHISSARPTRLFLLQNLAQGDARISGYNTVMTAQVDPNSSANAGKPTAAWTKDLFREFQWNSGKGTLVQVAFPGLYPDLTRYQAEADQARVTAGKQTWKNDAGQVAQHLGAQFFGWALPSTVKLVSGGGAKDVYATVQVVEHAPGTQPPAITVTLTRLEGNTHNLWVVIGVESGSGALTSVGSRSLVASPVKIEGQGSAFEGDIGEASILDHLYTVVGRAHLTAIPGLGMGISPYAVQVSYDVSFKDGPQEGVVEVQQTNPMGIGPHATVMVKVLLDPQPRVASGPVSCPLKTDSAAYWQPILGLDTTKFSLGTITCANLKGDPQLEAVLPVYHTDGSQLVDVYVYDKITSARPVQLFKVNELLRGGAMISGYSTLLTAQVDPNSSINTGKTGDQLTVDLYREFGWDGKSGSFVQVVFPGMYPDLTRWQAEVAQDKTLLQQDTWKLDAMKTAQHFVAQFVRIAPTTPPIQLQLVSGGGAHDLTAQIKAAFPITRTQLGPVTKITLKRLEGNVNGVWEVTAVQADWVSISSPKSGSATQISNPVTVTGYGSQFESQVGTVYILDHLSTSVGSGYAMGSAGFGSGPFTVTVPYVSSYRGGAQEGIVELVHTGGASFDYGLVFVKVLVNP
jgi:hypothetical protein